MRRFPKIAEVTSPEDVEAYRMDEGLTYRAVFLFFFMVVGLPTGAWMVWDDNLVPSLVALFISFVGWVLIIGRPFVFRNLIEYHTVFRRVENELRPTHVIRSNLIRKPCLVIDGIAEVPIDHVAEKGFASFIPLGRRGKSLVVCGTDCERVLDNPHVRLLTLGRTLFIDADHTSIVPTMLLITDLKGRANEVTVEDFFNWCWRNWSSSLKCLPPLVWSGEIAQGLHNSVAPYLLYARVEELEELAGTFEQKKTQAEQALKISRDELKAAQEALVPTQEELRNTQEALETVRGELTALQETITAEQHEAKAARNVVANFRPHVISSIEFILHSPTMWRNAESDKIYRILLTALSLVCDETTETLSSRVHEALAECRRFGEPLPLKELHARWEKPKRLKKKPAKKAKPKK